MESPIAGPSRTQPLTPMERSRQLISLDQVTLDEKRLDHEIALVISEYLHSRPNGSIAQTFDEQLLGIGKSKEQQQEVEEVERGILDGEWGLLEGLIGRPGLKAQSQRAFLYMCYRQQLVEHIENRESQKAFNLLQKRLKPLEHYQPVPYDFYNLCYLTSAGTVHDAPGLREWGGAGPEREKLVGMWRELTDVRQDEKVPPGRLLTLLRQAAAWQVGNARKRSKPWTVSLLQDYQVRMVPDRLRCMVTGHQANVKCVDVSGDLGVSGSSDCTLRIFSVDGTTRYVLRGHTSRVWDCSMGPLTGGSGDGTVRGPLIASGSGDGTVRIWDDAHCRGILNGDGGDVYSVRWRRQKLVTASYDRILRVWDVETGKQIRTFSGHSQSTLAVAADHTGGLLASGSKDKHLRLWDAVSGVCVKTMTALGEITSVEFDSDGKYLLAGCKDNTNRLWDLRMQRNIYRYTGHQNTSKNLIRCAFGGADCSFVVGGSEDGRVYVWDREASTPSASTQSSIVPDNSASASSTPLMTSPQTFGSMPLVSKSVSLGIPSSGYGINKATMDSRASPAYYPPRETRSGGNGASGGTGTNVKPTKVLEGHGQGAVFDVKWFVDGLVSGGEDSAVAVWENGYEE